MPTIVPTQEVKFGYNNQSELVKLKRQAASIVYMYLWYNNTAKCSKDVRERPAD